jgi:hypothetical protein
MTTWIEDDSSVIDAIEAAKAAWFEAHPECAVPTSETTDENINKSLGLPPSGALRPLADEFADWSEADIQSAVESGLDAWWNRAEIRYELLSDYSAAPEVPAFHACELAELERISAEINDSEQSSLQTEWSRAAWETDRESCARAMALLRSGQAVLVARDEDGFYFATERA